MEKGEWTGLTRAAQEYEQTTTRTGDLLLWIMDGRNFQGNGK